MFVTYFFGCYWLPAFLTWFEFDFIKLGPQNMGDEKLKRCASPKSNMQDSESSEIEETTDDFLNSVRGSDVEANMNTMAACIAAAPTGGSNNGALEFLPCFTVPNCGAADVPSEATAVRTHGSCDASKASDSSETDEARDTFEPVEPPTSPHFSPDSLDQSNSVESTSLNSNFTSQQSLISVASSQMTLPVNNTRTAQENKVTGTPVACGLNDRKGATISRGNYGLGLVGNLSAESRDNAVSYDLAATSTESSNVFDGVDTVSSRDTESPADRTQNQVHRSMLNRGILDTLPEKAPPSGEKSPGYMGTTAQSVDANSQIMNPGHPPLRQTPSSPEDAQFSISPIGGFGPSNFALTPATCNPIDTSSDSLLQNANFVGLQEESYDFTHVSDQS